ncbi:hypothetical protein GTA62_03790 [Roseobacter sp. HKCCD9010]|uniref:hypothetical protein n=1 Tax=Rhodobacterales TaxID=204455 RepID=UPI00149090C4|nr:MULTISPECIES: hypothetical protein [Rhodobacterales]MBF9049010.1 hypothetical protein [Rhodobacterales bacterium HKCCD4356]NNV11010.1 hypothetical protein [Roseobacter sp. HKCCD7357]NNV15194.1 hypothetical protein [Roseobacter sp. HKCCD8768]NNV24654.1 hypothetical protein [Roseobacter sp. HKCCD8192]NNV28910.1 hypothetical protein [Roseobacter sp. HKCCD9061]
MGEKLTFALDHDHVQLMAWMVECPDPNLWHELVVGLDLTTGLGLDSALWIVQQPDCDMATAAAALIRLEAWEYVIVPLENKTYADPRIFEIAKVICNRSEAEGYHRNLIGWDRSRLRFTPKVMLQHIYAFCELKGLAREQTYLPIPINLLSGDFDKALPMREYIVDESSVTHISALDSARQQASGYVLH